MYGLKVAGMAGVNLVPGMPDPTGLWIVDCDWAAGDGIGEPILTDDPDEAKHFVDQMKAFEFWRTVSPVRPVRPWDGEPNRPLTAFTVSVEPLPVSA